MLYFSVMKLYTEFVYPPNFGSIFFFRYEIRFKMSFVYVLAVANQCGTINWFLSNFFDIQKMIGQLNSFIALS
jgi:hypothetical protein